MMATATNLLTTQTRDPHVRPFDVRTDLAGVADLVEEAFYDSLDADGQRYLSQMRRAARNPGFIRWAGSLVEQVSLPLWGYVWEDDGKVVGNLSLIPFTVRGQRRYLIANVAVKSTYRRHGIGRALTSAGIEHARQRNAEAVWLHVREENTGAIALYEMLGFVEHTRRTSWEYTPSATQSALGAGAGQVMIAPRGSQDWPLQQQWLAAMYPPDLAWHMPLNTGLFEPGISGWMQRLAEMVRVHQWTAWRGNERLGIAAVRRAVGSAGTIWLATPPKPDEGAVYHLLAHILRHNPGRQPLTLDYPAHTAEHAIRAAGFTPHQTLIWMSITFPPKD